MDLSFNLAPSYRDLKDPTSRQNFEDTPGQIPKLILTLRPTPNQLLHSLKHSVFIGADMSSLQFDEFDEFST